MVGVSVGVNVGGGGEVAVSVGGSGEAVAVGGSGVGVAEGGKVRV